MAVLLLSGSEASASRSGADELEDFHRKWAWSVSGEEIGYAGLEIADLDGDGTAEILATADASPYASRGYWYQLVDEGGLVQTWSSLPVEQGLRALRLGGSGEERRIVVATSNSVEVYDALTKARLSTFSTQSTDVRALAVADLDGDSTLEAVVCDSKNLYVHDLSSGTAEAVRYGFGCTEIVVGQTDVDAPREIAIAGNTTGGFVLDGVTLAVDWGDVRGFGNRLRLADLDGDGRDDVISTIENWEGIRAQDPDTGLTLWEDPLQEVVAIQVADVDPTPGPEVLWGEGQWGDIHVLRGSTGTQLWSILNPNHGVTAIGTGDIDGDGVVEILWGAGHTTSGADNLYVAGSDTRVVETQTDDLRGPLAGFAVADVDGEGTLELATASRASDSWYGPGVIFELSYDQGRVVRTAPQVWPGSFGLEIPRLVAVQLDADAAFELCVVGGTYDFGSAGCYDGESFAEEWRLDLPRAATTLAFGELDEDPIPEILVGADGGYVYAFEGETGWLKWRTPDPQGPQNGFNRVLVTDLNGDELPEVIAGFGYQASYDGELTTFAAVDGARLAGPWTEPLTSMALRPLVPGPGNQLLLGNTDGSIVPIDPLTGNTGPPLALFPERVEAFAVGDFNRDGVADIAAAGGGHLRVHDGAGGAIVWTSPFLGDWAGQEEALLVGDFDGDSIPELVVGTGVGATVFESPLFVLLSDGFESGDTSAWTSVVP